MQLASSLPALASPLSCLQPGVLCLLPVLQVHASQRTVSAALLGSLALPTPSAWLPLSRILCTTQDSSQSIYPWAAVPTVLAVKQPRRMCPSARLPQSGIRPPCPKPCPACTAGAAGPPSSPTRKRPRHQNDGQPDGGNRESRQRFEPVSEQRAHSGWQAEGAGAPYGQGGAAAHHELPGAPAHHVPMQQGPGAAFGVPATQPGDLTGRSANPLGEHSRSLSGASRLATRPCWATGGLGSRVAERGCASVANTNTLFGPAHSTVFSTCLSGLVAVGRNDPVGHPCRSFWPLSPWLVNFPVQHQVVLFGCSCSCGLRVDTPACPAAPRFTKVVAILTFKAF